MRAALRSASFDAVVSIPRSVPRLAWPRGVPALRRPVMVAAFEGWNDAGDAATIAARCLAERFDAQRVAEVDPEEFYDFSTIRPFVRLDDDRRRSLAWPGTEVLAAEAPEAERDLIVVLGVEPQLRWRTFCGVLCEAAEALGASQVLTLGALLSDVPHTRPVQIFGTSDDESLMSRLDLSRSGYQGPTGIVGVLSSELAQAGFEVASFWAAVPSYAPRTPSPKAAAALVRRSGELLGLPVSATDLEADALDYEQQVSKLISDDADVVDYLADLERAWDAEHADAPVGRLTDNPEQLVAEVENFLRENP